MVWFVLALLSNRDAQPHCAMKFSIARYRVSIPDTRCWPTPRRCPADATCLAFSRFASEIVGAVNGQTLLEFAFILPIFLLLMLGIVQMVIVGGAALAVNQAAVTCSRYAALNPSYTSTQINSYLTTIASPLINDTGLQPITLSPSATPRSTGSSLSVTVTYELKTKLFLGSSFFGVTFPTQVSVTQTVTSE